MKTNSTARETGLFTTQTHEKWRAPVMISEEINLFCNASGKIETWPAFWLVTGSSWPAGGEIDVMEGLHGTRNLTLLLS